MKYIFLFLTSCTLTNTLANSNSLEGQCSIEKKTCEDVENENTFSNYNKFSNEILEQIRSATVAFESCPNDDVDCSCHRHVILEDLTPFKSNGITKELFNKTISFGIKYQIVDNHLYRDKTCSYQSRCAGIEHFIKPILHKLPNMELIINVRDWPQIRKEFGIQGPVFSFSKTHAYLDIMYPAWSFWEGGPAISLHPTGIGRWDLYRNIILKASEKWPWKAKKSQGFFRGSRTSDERDSIVLLSRSNSKLVDAQYTKNQAWKSPSDTLNAEPAPEVSFENHCQYKYLFNFRGVAASFRLKHLFLCKSLVFHVGNEWSEFFYSSMKPWVHYIPINTYPTQEEIEKILNFFKQHDDLAQQIARKGFNYIWHHLRMEDIHCYWENLLTQYGQLMRYDVKRDENLKEIK